MSNAFNSSLFYNEVQLINTNNVEVSERLSALFGTVNIKEESDEKFEILKLPNEIIFKIYSYFDLETRRALRVDGRLEEIESKLEFRIEVMNVEVSEQSVQISFEDTELEIPHSEVEKEFEMMGNNTVFEQVHYDSYEIDDRRTIIATKFLKAKRIDISDSAVNDVELQSVVQKKEEVNVFSDNINNYMRIYQKMVNPEEESELKKVRITSRSDTLREQFLEELGIVDIGDDEYAVRHPNQEAWKEGSACYISEGRLQIVVQPNEEMTEEELNYSEDMTGTTIGWVEFEIYDQEDDGESDENADDCVSLQND